jgi:beta-phosphoglucomutase
MEALDIILGERAGDYGPEEKRALADRKNAAYRARLPDLGPGDRLPGVDAALALLKDCGIAAAIGSSSRNAPDILRYLGLEGAFDAVVSGNDIERSKPFPDVFLIAAERLGVAPALCLVVEDAAAGIEAARAAGMRALSVGPEPLPGADLHLPDLTGFSLDALALPPES